MKKFLIFLLTIRLRSGIITKSPRVIRKADDTTGSIAQLGEHMPYKHGVTGSSPVVPTIQSGPVVQSVSTPACHAGGRRFESVPGRHYNLIEMSNHLNMPL